MPGVRCIALTVLDGRVSMNVVPPLVFPHETAGFVVNSTFAVVPEMCRKFHDALRVERASLPGGKDVQAVPLQIRIQIQRPWPGPGMPGSKQVFLLKQNKGAVPRAHQLFRSGGVRLSCVEAAAALVVRFAREAWATFAVRQVFSFVVGSRCWIGESSEQTVTAATRSPPPAASREHGRRIVRMVDRGSCPCD